MSFLSPPVKIKRIALPRASVARWILVECPPRERPKLYSPCFFALPKSKREREQLSNQSTGIPDRGQPIFAQRVFQRYRVHSTEQSVCKCCSNCRNSKAINAIASRNELSKRRLRDNFGNRFLDQCRCLDKSWETKVFSPIDDYWILQLTFC